MDEFRAILKAWELARRVNSTVIPAAVEAYAAEFGAVIRPQRDLEPTEPGWSFESDGKHYICTNANDAPERQRFTICHEIAHIALQLPSEHTRAPWSGSYSKKSPDEIVCDVFAAELLLPFHLFKPLADKCQIGFVAVGKLAEDFAASVMATGSRFATVINVPCAFVLSEQGKVRYTSRSTSLRDANAWITPRSNVPDGSMTAKVRGGAACDEPDQIDADVWLENWRRGGTLLEEACHLSRWDQTLTLLWFEDEEIPASRNSAATCHEEEDQGLPELDGVLPWPGKKRRR